MSQVTTCRASRLFQSCRLKHWRRPILAAVVWLALSGLNPARAYDAVAAYVGVFDLIQQGDAASTNANPAPAISKYRQASVALQNLRNQAPDWNAPLVQFRLNYINERIAALSQPGREAAGVSSAAGSSGSTQRRPTTAAAGASAEKVKLVSPGSEPRKALRFHPAAGDKQTTQMTLQVEMQVKTAQMDVPAMKIPPIRLVMDSHVKSVSPDGDIAFDTVITDVSMEESAEAPAQVTDALKKSLGSVKGMTGNGIMTSRGIHKSMELKLPAQADAQAKEAMEQMKESISQLGVPLPEEPIGVGAKWQSRKPLKSRGMIIDQTADYELVAVDGDQLSLKSTVSQTAGAQKVQNPTMAQMKMDLSKMTGKGAGEMQLDIAHLMPLKGTADFHSDMSFSFTMGGTKQQMDMSLGMNMKLETK